MKKLFLFLTLIISFVDFAQDEMPASVSEVINWNFKVVYGECDDATVVITVNQKDGWHVYAQKQPEGAVGMPTEFIWEPSQNYELVGSTKEYGTEIHEGQFPEKIFPGNKAVFKQKIKIKSKKDFDINFKYTYMACKESCFPPEFDQPATVKVKGVNPEDCNTETTEVTDTIESEVEMTEESKIGFNVYAVKNSETEYELRAVPVISENWLLENKIELNFNDVNTKGELSKPNFVDSTLNDQSYKIYKDGYYSQLITANNSDTNKIITGSLSFEGFNSEGLHFSSKPLDFKIELKNAVVQKISDATEKGSYWMIFWLAFGSGLFALLTPCVFPMIPMTVSFFTKGSENRKKGIFKGIMYGVFILLIYVLLSLPFHLMDSLDSNILSNISTNGPLNIFFFLMLFIFALSFLGAFEIVLPAKWTNKADSKADLGGLIGVFFMALTLVLVSFSCTGPILGSLLASASGGGAWNLTWGMAGFGLALGLPFALFAIFPSWLNSLPQSGGWLNNVKVVLGFLELAFAFKFLSNADLSIQAHLLEREVFIAIWIGIFGAMALYLFGTYTTKHDSPLSGGLGTFRVILATITLGFTVYMIPGLFGAPLKLISAFPPPVSYSEIPYGIHGHAPSTTENLPDGAKFEHGLMVFKNYDKAKAYAEEVNKPLMLDFTGHNCVNCRKMETNVWSDEKVHELMKEDFVVVSLAVDERVNMPAPETSPYTGKELITWGDKWSDMQSALYKKNAQPQYIALDKQFEIMNSDATYETHGSPELFETWLKDALVEYEKRGDMKLYLAEIIYDSPVKE
ncbi:MAG: protein-disulfide reductase DsbD family protein [Putridiphycobacter sp.]